MSIDPSDVSTADDSTIYDTEDEAFSDPILAHFSPVVGQKTNPGQPIKLDVNLEDRSSSMPLCLILNARSVMNKSNNLREMLHNYGPDISIISETWERHKKRLNNELNSQHFKAFSYFRKNRAPGGGCAIIYNETRFSFQNLEIPAVEEIECVWALCTPKQNVLPSGVQKVKRIGKLSKVKSGEIWETVQIGGGRQKIKKVPSFSWE